MSIQLNSRCYQPRLGGVFDCGGCVPPRSDVVAAAVVALVSAACSMVGARWAVATDRAVTKITGRTDAGHQPRLGLPRR